MSDLLSAIFAAVVAVAIVGMVAVFCCHGVAGASQIGRVG